MVCILEFQTNRHTKCLDDIVKAGHAGGLVVGGFVSLDLLFFHTRTICQLLLAEPQRDPCFDQSLRKFVK